MGVPDNDVRSRDTATGFGEAFAIAKPLRILEPALSTYTLKLAPADCAITPVCETTTPPALNRNNAMLTGVAVAEVGVILSQPVCTVSSAPAVSRLVEL